jgi:hypothetical protein
VIGKISARGRRVAGLLYYLYGPGRSEAHTYPHLVAGWRDPAELVPRSTFPITGSTLAR